MQQAKHYGDKDGLKLLSYDAIIYECLTNRNYGKTWTFKKRAFKRAFKHGKKTIWLRLFKKEAKEAAATFLTSKNLQDYCGVSLYDKDANPNGNIKQVGRTFYYRKQIRGKWTAWQWCLKIFALNDVDAIRSADDVKTDTIIFDEFTKPANKYKLYRGNIANDFLDILFSSKREHQIKCILLGNKESVNNPIMQYFNITPLPANFEGIRVYKKGAFVLQQINNDHDKTTNYNKKLCTLLDGTPYGNFIYKHEFKNIGAFKARKTPSNANIYCQLIFDTNTIKISVLDGFYYVNTKIDKARNIYCDALTHKYKNEHLLVKRQRRLFNSFVTALSDNRVFYDSAQTYEATQPFLKWLAI